MLDDLLTFAGACRENYVCLSKRRGYRAFVAADLFCPTCGDPRRMAITPIWTSKYDFDGTPSTYGPAFNDAEFSQLLENSIYSLTCVQCTTGFTALIYSGPDGVSLAIFPTVNGGARTANTPEGVAFYLDQAQRAQSVGAFTAAVAMYRGALEQLLFQQGYQKGMLAEKINTLVDDVNAKKAPKWAMEVDPEFLKLMKDLGNGSIHPNDGDITKQKALDGELVNLLGVVFHSVLFLAYEVQAAQGNALAELRRKAAMLKK